MALKRIPGSRLYLSADERGDATEVVGAYPSTLREGPPSRAVRILIGYEGQEAPNSELVRAILARCWDGSLDMQTHVTAHRIPDQRWSSLQELAYAWKTLQMDLRNRETEPPAWEHYKTKAWKGQVTTSGQQVYVEVYYEESCTPGAAASQTSSDFPPLGEIAKLTNPAGRRPLLQHPRVDPTVGGLVKQALAGDRQFRLQGLGSIAKRSAEGDPRGLCAIQEAIRVKSGNSDCTFYSPSLRIRKGNDILQARAKLIELARSGDLLNDPAELGDLMLALRFLGFEELTDAAHEIEAAVGEHQFHALQLVWAEQKAWFALDSSKRCDLSKEQIEAFDMTPIEAVPRAVASDLRKFGQFYPWRLTVSGYSEDPRELPEIHEVRQWCVRAIEGRPFLAGLLNDDSLRWLLLCLLDVTIRPGESGTEKLMLVDPTQLASLQARLLDESVRFLWTNNVQGEAVDWIVSEIGSRLYGSLIIAIHEERPEYRPAPAASASSHVASSTEAEHVRRELLLKLQGDSRALERLLEYERRREPGADETALTRNALGRLERDRR